MIILINHHHVTQVVLLELDTMVSKQKLKLNELRLRWHSFGSCLSDGVPLKHIKSDLKSLIRDTRSFIKTVRFTYDT